MGKTPWWAYACMMLFAASLVTAVCTSGAWRVAACIAACASIAPPWAKVLSANGERADEDKSYPFD